MTDHTQVRADTQRSQARPFPYKWWRRLSARQAQQAGQLHRLWPELALDGGLLTASRLLGTTVSANAGDVWQPATEPTAPCTIIGLADTSGETCLGQVRIPVVAARLLADRVLGGEGDPAVGHATGTLGPFATGALAYLAARVLAGLGSTLQLQSILPAGQTGTGGGCWSRRLSVCVGVAELSMELIVMLNERQDRRPPPVPPGRDRLIPWAYPAAYGTIPITLVAEVGRAVLPCATVDALNVGDIVVPDGNALTWHAGRWAGSVRIQIAGSQRTRWWWKADGHDLVWLQRPTSTSETSPMTEPPGQKIAAQPPLDPIELGGDAPIALTLEVARFTLPLEQVLTLRAGDVLQSGSPIGEHVTIVAAGIPIATGELVDVDGETGVRVMSVKTGRPTQASK